MNLTWLSLLPPLVVIGTNVYYASLKYLTHGRYLISSNNYGAGAFYPALHLCARKLMEHFSDSDMIFLYTLLIVISSLIVLLTTTGSAVKCARIISKKMKTAEVGNYQQ